MDLTALIQTFRGPLMGLIASWGVPWTDAMELAQESLADAWLKRDSCRGDWQDREVFGRWLRGIARNRYRNWARSRRHWRWRTVSLAEGIEPAGETYEADPSEPIEALRAAIDRLPHKQRQVVLMHYLEETSVNQVAAMLSISTKAVEGRLYQARRALARMLGTTRPSQFGKLLL